MKKNKSELILYIIICVFVFCLPVFGIIQDTVKVNSKTKEEVVNKIASIIKKNYVFSESGKKMALSIKEKLRNGDYSKIKTFKEFSKLLQTDLRKVCNDRHIFVSYKLAWLIDDDQALLHISLKEATFVPAIS